MTSITSQYPNHSTLSSWEVSLKIENLNHAVRRKDQTVVERLIKTGAKPTMKTYDMAIRSGAYQVLTDLLQSGVKPDTENLIVAIELNDITAVQLLFEAGVEPTSSMYDMIIEGGYLDAAIAFLEYGALPSEKHVEFALAKCGPDSAMYNQLNKAFNQTVCAV